MSQAPDRTLSGQTIVITGATSGIGQAAAQELARRGGRILLVSRDPARLSATLATLTPAPGFQPHATISADLSTAAGVAKAAQDIAAQTDRVHVLLNNAGAIFQKRETTFEGLEKTFALNHLAYFDLTCRLAPLMRAAGSARIVSVASGAHHMARNGLDFDDLQWERRTYRAFPVYGHSKLANILFTRELARRLEGTGVTANALHPGVVATRIFSMPTFGGAVVRAIAPAFFLSPEKGAATSIHLASSPDVATTTGLYFDKCKPAPTSPAAQDDTAAQRLWEISKQLRNIDLS